MSEPNLNPNPNGMALSPEPPKPERDMSIGVVSGCKKLNVRAKAFAEALVVCELPVGKVVIIENDASTDEFYRINTEDGTSGYCIKKYVTVQE